MPMQSPSDVQLDALINGEGHAPCPGVVMEFGIPIQEIGGWHQHATMIRPERSPGGGSPAFVCFHGGGFESGDPDGCGRVGKFLAITLGITTIAPSYRLAAPGRPTYPKPIHDAADAWRWVATEAVQRWNLDATRIAVGGESAGVPLASHVVLTRHIPELAGGGQRNGQGPPPAALVAMWGPLDFVARWFDNGEQPGAEQLLFGTHYAADPALYHRASPLSYVRSSLPPALFIYGSQDRTVHPRQAFLGEAAWRAAGNHAESAIFPNIGHGVVGNNAAPLAAALAKIAAFLEAHLHL